MLPFLFAIFLNDLEHVFSQHGISGLNSKFNDDDLAIYFKMFLLIYADGYMW